MKIFIEWFGVVAQSITRKLLENHSINPKNIYIKTYDLVENSIFLDYVNRMGLHYQYTGYSCGRFYDSVNEFSPDILMSLYGRSIIPVRYLKLAKLGTFNLHSSLLPQYKGCFSAPWAIINLEEASGITIHELVEKVDCGRILYQESIPIYKSDLTISELAEVVKAVSSFEGKIQFDESMPDGTPRKLMDSSRLNNFGWRSSTSLDVGVSKAYLTFKEVVT